MDRLGDLAARQQANTRDESPFQSEVGPIRAELKRIQMLGAEADVLRDAYLATNSDSKKRKLDSTASDIEQGGQTALALITRMEQKTAADVEARRINRSTGEVRRRVTTSLLNELHAELKRQQDAQATFDRDLEGQVARRVRVRYSDKRGQHKSDEECRQMARVMIKGRAQDYLFLQARAELEDAVAQYNELLELQEDVSSLVRLVDHLYKLTKDQEREVESMNSELEANNRRVRRGVTEVERAREVGYGGGSS